MGENRMIDTKQSIRKEKHTLLKRRVLRSVMALGFAVTSWAGVSDVQAAGTITRVNGKEENLMQNGKADIFAEAASGTVGLNRFDRFEVANQELANLYFRKENDTQTLDTLVNTVNNRIDIQGTVNAIRDNKVGGNLYFLSPKGMVVGAGGVINAGSLMAISTNKLPTTADEAVAAVTNIKDGSYETSNDLSSSIVIHGAIHAATGIDLRAASIELSKEGNGESPLLRTGVLFDTTVNNDKVTSVSVKEGKLTASLDKEGHVVIADPNDKTNEALKGDGGIYLRASADGRNDKTEFLGLKAYDNTVIAKATVGEGTTIDAIGNVEISSETQLSNNTKLEQWWNFMGFTKAETEVNGRVSGANVNITSTAKTDYSYGNFANFFDVLNEVTKQGGMEFNSKFTNMLWEKMEKSGAVDKGFGGGASTLNKLLTQLYMPFNITDAKATTTIGKTADIASNILKDAQGKPLTYTDSKGEVKNFTSRLQVSANSTVSNKMKVKLQPHLKQGTTDLSKYFTGGFIYEDSSSHAIVNIDGKLTADGDMNVEANAENANEAALEINQPKFYNPDDPSQEEYQGSMFMAGANIVFQDTNAEVNIGQNKNDTTLKAKGDVAISANSDNSLSSEVSIATNSSLSETPSEDTALSTVVNVVGTKGNAIINNYGTLHGENVELNAEHTLSGFDLSTSNDFEGEFTGLERVFDSDTFKATIDNSTKLLKAFRITSQNAAGNNVQNPGGGQDPAWNQYFDVGAAIAVANVNNKAQINLQPTSTITATGNVALNANVNIEDTHMVTSDVIVTASDNVKFGASAAVAVETMNNTAEINMESDIDSKATIDAEGDVALNASVEQRYTRVKNLAQDFLDGYNSFIEHWTDWSKPGIQDKFKKLQNIAVDIDTILKKDKAPNAKDSKLVVKKAMAAYDILKEFSGAGDLLDALEAFADASSYANMYVASAAKGGADKEIPEAKGMASGSVGVQNLHNTANINLGANTKITSDGQVDLKANVVESNLQFIGKQALIPTIDTTKKTENGLGGSVGVQNSYNNSGIKVMNGVEITAGSISLATDNDILNIGLVYGGTQTSKLGITGMVSYMGGESNAKTLVDDDVIFTASKKVDNEDGEDTVSADGAIAITAKNNANVINVVGGVTQTKGSSIGASTGVISYDVHTLAKVENQEVDEKGNSTETKETEGKKGKLRANSVRVDAITDGIINNLTVAGSINSKTENANADSGGVNVAAGGGQAAAGNGGVAGAAIGQNDAKVKLNAVGSVSWNYVVDETAAKLDGVDVTLTTPEFGEGVKEKDMSTSLSVNAEDKSYIGAYSGAMALSKMGETDTTKFRGSLSGAVAVNDLKKSTSADFSHLSVTGNTADIRNSAINSGVQVATGLSLGLETGKHGDGTSINLAASGSANYVDSTVHATMSDNTLTGTDMTVNNISYDKDVQVAGGVTAEFAGATASVGAAVTVNHVKNDIQAAMQDNTVIASSVNNLAASNLTQVGTAISVGVATGDKAYATLNVAVADNEVTNTVNSSIDGGNIMAFQISAEARDGKLSGTEETNKYTNELNTIPGSLTNFAGDEESTSETKHIYDLDGSDALKEANGATGADVSASVTEGEDTEKANYKNKNIELTNKGNTIVGVALGLGVKTGDSGKLNGTGAAAAVINQVKNDFQAKISHTTLTATQKSEGAEAATKVIAGSDTRMVGVAAGVAVGANGGEKPSLSLSGSGVKQTIHNDTIATVEDATMATDRLDVQGTTASSLVSVAGQVSAETSQKGVAGGLSWAENEIQNTTGAYAKGLTLQGISSGATNLHVLADNQAKVMAVSVGAGGSLGYVTAEGAYASNHGTNQTEAIVDQDENGKRNTLTHVNGITIQANDEAVEKAVAGSLAVTVGLAKAGATLGGAVSYNNIGNSANDKQKVQAKLSYADITTAENSSVNVLATNRADFLTLALGGATKVGGTNFGISAQGSVATSTLYTDTYAGMNQTTLNQGKDYSQTKLYLKANSQTKLVTSADALSINASIGVDGAATGAVSVVRSDADTRSEITDSQLKLQDVVASAQSENEILDIATGLGIGVSTDKIGISAVGNIVTNRISNDTTLNVENSTIDANGTAALLAHSKERLRNYGGALSVGASGGAVGAALGVTVVTNTIEGNTTAVVNNSSLTAAGNSDGVEITDHTIVNDGDSNESKDPVKNYQKHKVQDTKTKKKGLIVNADAVHELRDISVTAGVGASATVGAAVDATVVLNTIAGKTGAEINNTDINKNVKDFSKADVSVTAYDKGDISSHIGTLSVGAAGTVGVGAAGAGDRNILSRETTAKIANVETKALNAHNVEAKALGNTKLYISESGVGVGASGVAAAGVTGSVSSDTLTGNTTALVTGVSGKVHSLTIEAERLAKVDTYNNAIALSGGVYSGSVSVGVTNIDDSSHTNAELSHATLDTDGKTGGSVNVLANSHTELGTELSGDALAVSIGGAAGISVLNANMESQVGTKVSHAILGNLAQKRYFGDVNVKSLNDVYSRYQNVAVGVGSLLGVAVAKGALNINTGTTADIWNSHIYAAQDITVSADEKRTIDSDMVGVGVGALNVGVNVMYTNIGTNLKDSYTYETGADTGSYDTSEFQNYVNDALKRLNQQADLAKEKTGDTSISHGSDTINRGHVNADGVKTTISQSVLKAGNILDVGANTTTNTDIDIKQASVAVANIAVAANRVDVEDKLGIDIDDAVLEGKSVGIGTLSDGKIASYTGQGGVSIGAFMDTTGYILHHGKNQIRVDGSQITATENAISLTALNQTKIDNTGLGLNISGLATGRLLLESEDATEVSVALGKNSQTENHFNAKTVMAMAQNAPQVRTENKAGVNVGVVAGSGSLVIAKATGKVGLDVTKQNSFEAANTMLLATAGGQDEGEYTVEAINHAVGVTAGSVTVDKARTITGMETTVNMGAAKFMNGNGYGNLVAGAMNNIASHSYITTTSVGLGLASSSNFAQSYSANKATLTIDTGADTLHVNDLDAFTSNKEYVETQADGSAAGVLAISPYLSKVENTVHSTTKTTITGNLIASGKITAQAVRSDEYNLKSDSLTVTVGGGGAAGAESQITNDTELNLENANLISGGDVLLDVENNTQMNQKKDYDQMIRGAAMGVFTVNRSVLDNTLVSNAKLILNKAKILAEGDLQLISHNDEKLQLNGYVYNVSALGGAETVVNNQITNNDTIRLQDSNLKTGKPGKDITISAADDLEFFTYAYAETTTGALSGANALLTNHLTRNNIIDVSAGKNTLYSNQDIKLYAGKNADGSLGLLDMNTVAADFIGATIPVAVMPSVKNTLEQNNQITIGKDSASRSVRHTELYASQGREMANVSTNRYMGIYNTSENGSFVTTDKGETIEGKTANNFVKIDGSAVAGIANKIDIVIGKSGDVVILDEKQRETVSGAKGKDAIQIYVKADESTGLTEDSLTFGSEDYTSTLYKRYEEVQNLMIEYAKDGENSAVYQGYKAEAERIKQEMLSMGLAELDTDGNIVPKISLSVDYVEIPELTGSGGNITVDTDDFMGSGTVKAQGSPEINITNNTNLMTKINSILVDDPGGKLVFNGHVVAGKDPADFNKNINALNKGNGASFGTVEAADGQSGKINITGNYNGSSISYNGAIYDVAGKKLADVNGSMKPMANILIQGNIYSKEGDVHIKSASDSIVIQGKTAKDAVAINGATITLDAANGNITQGYTDGIVNIGANVRDQYDQAYKDAISKGNGSHTIDTIKTDIKDGSEAKGSYIAGGSVYINASDINVNGVIQSGYGDYYADISDSNTQEAIKRINNAYDGQRELSDAAVTTGDRYKIINGGAIWDANEGCYKYRLNVYYNPSTKKILVQNVDASGGKIYLTGRISSTGNGQIICLDGVSDITVKNTTAYDLQLGDLITHDVSGLVSIQDTAKKTLTEITNGKTTVRKIDSKGQIGEISDSSTFDKNTGYDYNPLEGLKYTWTTGQESMTYNKYSKEVVTRGWSLKWSGDEIKKKLAEWTEKSNLDSQGISEGAKRPDGETIRIDTSTNENMVNVSQTKTSESITLDKVNRWSSGLWGYYRHTKMYWTEASGTRDTYDASIKADNPIHVKFIGKDANDGKIDISSNTGIEMTGNIGNTKLYETKTNDQVTSRLEKGTVTISSRDGSLLQSGGALYGENIQLAAAKNIQDINIVAGDVVNLSAVQDATGKDFLEQNGINITVNAGYLAKGNVVLGNMGSVTAETKDGQITYKPLEDSTGVTGLVDIRTTGSEGTISQKDGAVRIVSDRINLTSTNGSMYGQKQADGIYTALKVYAGQQPIGLDTLDASVNAKAKGNISLEQTSGDMRIGQIISTDGDVSLTVAKGSVVDALPYVSNDRGDADDLLARWRSLGLIDGNEEMQEAKNRLNHYTDKNKTKDLGDYKAWDANALLYAIQDSVVNQTSENLPKTSEKAPNVMGHNITITVADSVGLNSGNQKRIDMTTLLAKDSKGNYLHLDDLKALSKADASMVTWENDGKTAVITEKLPIGVQQTTKTKVNDDRTTTIIHGSLTLKSAASAAENGNAGNIFIEGRDQKNNDIPQVTKDLHLSEVATKVGDITISSLGGIYQRDGNTFVTGRNLYLTAANGSIGTKDQYIRTQLFGTDREKDGLSAVASGGIYIDQIGNNDLILRSISSGGDMYLGSDTSMVMGEINGTEAVNYIRAENNGSITLEARGGSLGEEETDENRNLSRKSNKGIRILNAGDKNGSQVTLKAKDNVFVTGVASHDGKTATKDGAAGVLNLTIGSTSQEKLQNIGISVDGSLHLNGDAISRDTASIYTSSDLQNENTIFSNDTYLGSAKNLRVSGRGNTQLVGTEKLTLEAGQDVEIEEEELASKNLLVTAGQDMRLENVGITADVAHLTAQKDISYKNKTKDLTVSSGTTMEAQNILLSAEQNHSLTTSGTLTAKQKATLQGEQGVTQSDGIIHAETVEFSSFKDSVNQTAGSVQATNTIAKAGKDISLDSETNKLQNVSIDAQYGSATIVSANDAAGDLTVTTVGKVGNDLSITNLNNGEANRITFDKNLQAGGKISITNEEADIEVAEGTTMDAEDISLVAKNHDVNFSGGEVIAKGTLSAEGQRITQSGGTIQGTKAHLTAEKAISQTSGSLIAKDTIAKAGTDITLASRTNKLQNVSIDAANGSAKIVSANDSAGDLNVTTVGQVKDNLTITNLKNGEANRITFDKNLQAGGNISITNEEADIDVAEGTSMSAQDISLASKNHDVNFQGGMVQANGTLHGEGNNVSISAGTLTGKKAILKATNHVTMTGGTITADKVQTEAEKTIFSGGIVNATTIAANKAMAISGGIIHTGNSEGLVQAGNLTMSDGLVDGKNLSVTADADINMSGGTIGATTANITAGTDFTQTGGIILADTVSLASEKAISQTGGSLIAKNMEAKAETNLALASRTNKLQNVSVEAKNGNATIISANDAAGDLTVTTVGVVGQDLTITNLANGEANKITFDKNLQAGGNISITNEEADIDIANGTAMKAKDISLVSKGHDVNFKGGTVKADGTLYSEGTKVSVSGGTLTANKMQTEAEKLTVSDGIVNAATVIANRAMEISGGMIHTGNGEGMVHAGTLTMTGGLVNGKNLSMTSDAGFTINNGTIKATTANITAGTDFKQTGGTIQADTASLTAKKAISQTGGRLVAKNMTAKAGQDISLASETNKLQNVSVDAQHGSATIINANDATGDLNVTTIGVVGKDLTITNLANGEANKITFNKNLQAGGNISITNEESDIDVAEGTTMKAKNITLVAKAHDVNFKGGTVHADGTLQGEGVNVSISAGTLTGKEADLKATNHVTMTGGTLTADKVKTEAEKTILSGGIIHAATVTANKAMEISGGTIHTGNNEGLVHAGSVTMSDGLVDGKTLSVTSDADIAVTGGTVKADTASLNAEKSISQTSGSLIAKNTKAKAGTDLTLASRTNQLQNVSVDAQHGNAIITSANDGEGDLHVTTVGTVGNNLTVTNLSHGKANDLVVDGNLQAWGTISLKNEEANISINEGAKIGAKDMEMDAKGDLLHDGGSITVTDKVTLEANGNILLHKGNLSAKNVDMVALGYIDETYDNGDDAKADASYSLMVSDTLQVLAGGYNAIDGKNYGVDLGSRFNKLSQVIMNADNGHITIGNGGDQDLVVSVQDGKTVNGNIDIHNWQGGTANDVLIKDSLQAAGTIRIQNDEKNVIVQKPEGSAAGGLIEGQKIQIVAAGNIENHHAISSSTSVSLLAHGNISNAGDIQAEQNILMETEDEGSIVNSGTVAAKGEVIIHAGKDIINVGKSITSGDSLQMNAGDMIWNLATISSIGSDVTLEAANAVLNATQYGASTGHGTIKAAGNVTLRATNPDSQASYAGVYNDADIEAGKDVEIDSNGQLSNAGNIKADGLVDVDAEGDLSNSGTIEASGRVKLSADQSLKNTGNITSKDSGVWMYAIDGLVNGNQEDGEKKGNISAKEEIDIFSYEGNVTNFGDICSTDGSVSLTAAYGYGSIGHATDKVSHITNHGTIEAAEDVLLETLNGNISNQAQITSKSGMVTMNAWRDSTYTGSESVGTINNGLDVNHYDDKADISAAKGITLKAYDSVGNMGDFLVTDTGNITVTADHGDIINFGNYHTKEGNIHLQAKEDVLNLGVMETEKENVEIISDDGSIYNQMGADLLSGDGDVILHAKSQNAVSYYYNDEGELVKVPDDVTIQEYADGNRKYVMIDGKSYDVIKNGSVFNAGDALAMNGTIRFISDNGDVTNYDDFDTLSTADAEVFDTQYRGKHIATGNVEISAKHGRLFNSKDIEAGCDVTLTAAEGLKNFAYNVYAGRNITLTATGGDLINSATLESYAGDVTLRAENGHVINGVEGKGKGDIITYGGNVTLSANGLAQDGTAGSVTNYGDIIAINANAKDKEQSGSITLISQHGNVDNFDDFNTYQKDGQYYKDYEANKHQSLKTKDASYNLANNNLTISAKEGHVFTNKDYLAALGNVTLEAKSGLDSFGKVIYAGKDITMNATEGDLFNRAELLSVEGDIHLKADKGSVANLTGGKLIARNGNVNLEAGADAKNDIRVVNGIGNSKSLSDIVTDGEKERLEAAKDHIVKTKQYYQASDGSWIEIAKTDTAEVVIPNDATNFKTEISYLDDNNQEISLATITGDRTSGLLEGYRSGDVVNRGDIIAQGKAEEGKGSITLHSKQGNVTNYDNFKLLNNQKSYDYLGKTGKAHFNPDTKYFYDEKGILLSDSDLNIMADKGYLYNDMNIISEGNVNLTSGKTLTIGTNVSSVTAKGNVIIRSNYGSVINDSHVESKENNIILDGATGVISQVSSDHLKASQGSISAVSTKGDIHINQLVAGKMAVAGTKEGHVNLGTVSGDDVLLYTEDENAKISIGEGGIHVKDHLFLQGNDFDISKIDRSENGGTLVVDVNGVGKDGTPAVVKGYLKLAIDGDVHFTSLQVSDADIQVSGKLAVDKLHVTGKGIFESQGYVTGVYGRAPYHDSSNALYFDRGQGSGAGLQLTAEEFWAIREGNPPTVRTLQTLSGLRERLDKAESGSETFGTDNNGWMNLYIDGPYHQRSNGLLLHIDGSYHSANQRWSAEDLSGKLLDYKPYRSYRLHYGDEDLFYDRYDLLE